MSEAAVLKEPAVSQNKITTRPKSTSVTRNFSNPSYHSALDLAKAYSGMVNSHLVNSNFENHTLKSAVRAYNKEAKKEGPESPGPKITRSKSTLLTKEGKPREAIRIENNRIVRNPEDQETVKSVALADSSVDKQANEDRQRQIQLREVLSRKTFRVPQYSEQLEQACNYKAKLEQEIKTLKALINHERKTKTKVSLNCNKIMNEIELTRKNYRTREEQNYHLNTVILTMQKQNNFLQQEINKTNQKNQKTLENVNEEEKQCQVLKKYVEKTRLVVMSEQKDVAKLKTMVTTSFNNMSNNYMNLNLLKSQKALLLADIDTQHSKNK